MVAEFLIKKFIINYQNIEEEKTRNAYVYLASIVGILCNLILSIIKISVGFISGSVSITADGFNNLSDMASSIITMVGIKLANRPADKEHPFGHGRMEYLSALVVAFMVMLVGVQFVKTSFERILNPVAVSFEIIPFILLLISLLIKLWLSRFNKYMGLKINSTALKAASVDALGDVFTSSCVLISFLAAKFTTLPIDGYVGLIVSAAILYAGYSLIKDTISPLLGEAPDEELVKKIKQGVLSYDNIIGVHDLIIHNYGVGKCMASIHAEIPSNIDLVTIHEIIDSAEREISQKLNIYLVIHMDPMCIHDDKINKVKGEVQEILLKYKTIKSMHDFRITEGKDKINIIFDIEVNAYEVNTPDKEEELKGKLESDIKKLNPLYNCVITIDKYF
ncbi:MAG: cation diffusion facilitator family transporter [Clostridiales bacterium]|uniref:cation diffusion facilitator family transporter n=1 Tax=Terrisporobacter sp. TaxID=1965305 RepID=UPI002A411958|nr:cation diffusion facilitator family transporter [Terrisporobacter sp.]MCI6459670.1 cation diffusion facilitator family transporter [Clostridium sp.]MDD5879488.1 cation diffusion facilitator family transporter [Clostridiales bacterium]MDD7755950.1 cation diffusion facilitator family transporter [Clostridiales bacterium]MDY4133872.1 cation diffusion facilitator family transporter [Terrisporobacter sp.]